MGAYSDKGSKGYLFSIVLVAVIGGLLFGYDTAVISAGWTFWVMKPLQ